MRHELAGSDPNYFYFFSFLQRAQDPLQVFQKEKKETCKSKEESDERSVVGPETPLRPALGFPFTTWLLNDNDCRATNQKAKRAVRRYSLRGMAEPWLSTLR